MCVLFALFFACVVSVLFVCHGTWLVMVGHGQAWSSASPRGRWRTGENGENWLQNHLWCPNVVKGLMIMMMMTCTNREDYRSASCMLCSGYAPGTKLCKELILTSGGLQGILIGTASYAQTIWQGIVAKPPPSRSLDGHRCRNQFLLHVSKRTVVLTNLSKQVPCWLSSSLRSKHLPKNAVIDVSSSIELQCRLHGNHCLYVLCWHKEFTDAIFFCLFLGLSCVILISYYIQTHYILAITFSRDY